MAKAYRVISRTSTRKSPDPASPDFEVWVDFEPETTVREWPAHAPVVDWVRRGNWRPAKAKE